MCCIVLCFYSSIVKQEKPINIISIKLHRQNATISVLNELINGRFVLIFAGKCCKYTRCCCLTRLIPFKHIDSAELFGTIESSMNHVTARRRDQSVSQLSFSTALRQKKKSENCRRPIQTSAEQQTDDLYIIICNCIYIVVINCGWNNNVTLAVKIVACWNWNIHLHD